MAAQSNCFPSVPLPGCNSILPKFIRFAALLCFGLALGSFSARANDTNATVRLILSADTAKPRDTITAALHFKMRPNWHIYWRNPGDAGIATSIKWTNTPGVTAGDIQWPVPEKSITSDLTDYIYNREVVLLIPLKLASDLPPGPLTLKGDVTWLDCDVNSACVLGAAPVQVTLNIGTETKPSAAANLIETWRNKLPASGASLAAKLSWQKTTNDDTRTFTFDWAATNAPTKADFYPYNQNYAVQLKTDTLTASTGRATLKLQIKKTDGDWLPEMAGLLVQTTDAGKSVAEISPSLESSAPQANSAIAPPERLTAYDRVINYLSKYPAFIFLSKLFAAFLGGLILNVMPCVLPVIALKVLGFVNQSAEAPARVRRLGLVYGIGVLVSFALLAALAVAAQRAGGLASWGDAFRDPRFELILTVLMTLIALNLFGVFEITLGSGVMSSASNLASRQGYGGAFFNGVLATLLATPCTAPFLGAAIAFAFTQPPAVTELVFLAAGAGLAFPFVMICWEPRLLKFLPKPGAWMERFKIVMGFPMLATAVWLVWVTSPNGDDALWLELFLVILALSAWIWGQFVQQARTGKTAAIIVTVALLAAAYEYIFENAASLAQSRHCFRLGQQAQRRPRRYQLAAVESRCRARQARTSGHPVLVDFTAKCCVTCQVNVKPVLESDAVRAKLTEINAVPLLEDSYTKDATVVAELNRYERAGVPLVLVYSPNPSIPPQVLPSVLTQGIVLDALTQATRQ